MRPITFSDYDKITDLIYELGQKTILELVVQLSRKNESTMDRYHYHKEFKYNSKYSDTQLYSIRRTFDYFLLLRKYEAKGNDIMIRVQDMYLVLAKLAEALKWFEVSGIFGIRSGTNELYIKVRPKSILINGLAGSKYIQFDPVAIIWENTGTQVQGIRITLGDPSIFSDISIDRFYGLYYILSNLDMYGCAQNMVNYLQRPEYGTNLKEFETNIFLEAADEKDIMTSNIKDNRKIPSNQRPKSYFDQIDRLN